ncbi:putative quinol monooxygenase [Kineococcus sp. SYSU DK004]|uniref:putative quinol monooxygenase n=1 Tax=Kineococcus sp. SYSU DK004 TaxID=3383125 RepID=UPI003D7E8560
MVVTGFLVVDAGRRDEYVAGCAEVVRLARAADGCLEFAVAADPLDPGRVLVLERWVSRAAAEAFRGSGPDEEQRAEVRAASVVEHEVAAARSLT